MAISNLSDDAGAPLLEHAVDGCADYRGRPVFKSSSGRWRSACFIIVVEIAERFAYYGIASNLITYLTGPLCQSTATAAENVNVWSGVTLLLPVLGAVVADSFLGRYRMIIVASLVYALGLGLLALSTTLSTSNSSVIKDTDTIFPDQFQVVLFFFSLYLVAIGQSGHKPCVQAFGADQFDEQDPEECKLKSSFFNWWSFGISVGAFSTRLVLNYIQDNLSWGLGFGIPCICMTIALAVFLLGTRTYRYSVRSDEKSPLARIGRVFVAAIRNWRTTRSSTVVEFEACGNLPDQQSTEQFKFLNKALIVPDGLNKQMVCSISDVEDAKAILKLFPIWTTSLVYGIVYAQSSTFFTKQGATMDRSVSTDFHIPSASLQCFINLAIILAMPVYDRVFVPTARAFTGKPAGITMLQRIGTGLILCTVSMVIAALVEMKRLKTAEDYGLIDKPNETIPMSFWWLVPQYVFFGLADVFTFVGLQEFFYDQVPKELRSVGISLFLSVLGVGSLLSSYLVSAIDEITSANGGVSWFADNLNEAHLDYFYWLLAALTALVFTAYLHFARTFIYKRFLNRALLAPDCLSEYGNVCSVHGVEDAKALLSVIPIWTTSFVYGMIDAQCATFFTKQGVTMDRTITPGFDVPAASLQSFVSLAIILTLPIYDRVFVPFARAFTGKPAGITMLQRTGTGLFRCTVSMIIAASVGIKRLTIAKEYRLVDQPNATIPMHIWWLIPQYVVLGVAEALTMVGLQEFSYNQFPTELRSVSLAFYHCILGVESF